MKINKVSLVAALALGSLLVCTSLASAQTTNQPARRGGRGQNIEQRVERLTTELKLTDDQKTKVKTLLEDTAKKRRELASDTSLTQEERRPKVRALMQDENKKMAEILTPDQLEKYKKLQSQRRPGRRNSQGQNGGAPSSQ